MVVFVVVAHTINKHTCKKQFSCLTPTALGIFLVSDHKRPPGGGGVHKPLVHQLHGHDLLITHLRHQRPLQPPCVHALVQNNGEGCLWQIQYVVVVILRGTKSSCASRGHGCHSRVEYLETRFHLKLVFESQPFYFFVMYIVVDSSGSEPLYKNLTGMLPNDVQVRWTQSTTHLNGSINILILGRSMRNCSSCTLLAKRKVGAGQRLEGPTYWSCL